MRMTTRVSERDEPTLCVPPSPSASSSSTEFEFAVSLSPTSKKPSHDLCPADELFYKGQLLPLQLSPRLDMVRTLLASSSSSSSSDTNTSGSRDSSGSSNDSSSISGDFFHLNECDSSRPSSATEDEEFKKAAHQPKKSRYFSLSLFSSVFQRKEKTSPCPPAKKIGASAKEVIKKYVKKVKKPLYDKLAPKSHTQRVAGSLAAKPKGSTLKQKSDGGGEGRERLSHHSSFSGNLSQRYPTRKTRSCVMSCPSSMRSSPSRCGVARGSGSLPDLICPSSSSMEELQNAIQGAIAHCKNSMAQTNQKLAAGTGD